jgi:hypothetical protein
MQREDDLRIETYSLPIDANPCMAWKRMPGRSYVLAGIVREDFQTEALVSNSSEKREA